MSLRNPFNALHRRALWYLAVKFLLSFLVLVYASNIPVTTTIYHAENGGVVNVTGNLTAIDKGLSKTSSTVSAAGTSCGSNVTFTGTPGTANTALTANHLIYTIQVNTTSNTPVSTCFTVTLTITPNGGSLTSYTVHIASAASVTPDQAINCEFDIGSALPASPYAFSVTVQ
jgi:hypothetical protein